MKIGRNDPCWCGSGQKFKRCHLARAGEKALPFDAIVAAIEAESIHETCLHPDASPSNCGKVISAHTLQRARVLQAIADKNNHVLTFFPPRKNEDNTLEIHRRGWHKVSVFSAFCDKHDSNVFSPLETKPFIASTEQIFLTAYRAICWELYQKVRAIKSKATLQKLLDRGMEIEEQMAIQQMVNVANMGFKKGLSDIEDVKSKMDLALVSKNYSPFRTYEIQLDGPLSIASIGSITPTQALDGAKLQVLHDIHAKSQWLPFGTNLRDGKPVVTFFWSKTDEAPQKYIESLNALSDAHLAELLAQFFFAHCENTYFSSVWWDSLGSNRQLFINKLAANENPYYFPPDYDLAAATTPWSILKRTFG